MNTKAKRFSAAGYGFSNFIVIEFSNALTIPANKELCAVMTFRIPAPYISVQRLDAMYQSIFHQKIERPINCGRGGIATAGTKFLEQVISTDRSMTRPNQFKNLAPQWRKAKSIFCAASFGGCNGVHYTLAVIMRMGMKRRYYLTVIG
tara:strand:+ start:9833 stop:10276 length:444 start_codon:yes stop_codon:yes gene_type:complete